jgi:hypothetical protein
MNGAELAKDVVLYVQPAGSQPSETPTTLTMESQPAAPAAEAEEEEEDLDNFFNSL